MTEDQNLNRNGVFIDLFSGCGGLSLGLMKAGWKGIFAIEKTESAFDTLRKNLVSGGKYSYCWPKWLPTKNMEVGELIENHADDLESIRGSVDLIAGGPPCQGFSHAGKRDPNDPRNKLAEQYIKVVEILQPRFLLLENVRGFNAKFNKDISTESVPYSQVVKKRLEDLGYGVAFRIIRSSDWGVPQHRPRFILIAKKGVNSSGFNPFFDIENFRFKFLTEKGLSVSSATSVKEAISDLEVAGKSLVPNEDSNQKGFFEIDYLAPALPSNYLKLLRDGFGEGRMNSIRLPRHSTEVKERFKKILDNCPRGVTLSKEWKEKFQLKKQAVTPLSANLPSATVTTLPDDILHYSEPRILTVRENARLQSFPDWFKFYGPYTTGGKLRKTACPRYTQVGNAVPPLLAEAMGLLIKKYEEKAIE